MEPSLGVVVLEYVKKYSTSSTKSLAKMIFAEHPELFQSMEHARKVVRYYRGSTGAQNRGKMNKEHLFPREKLPESSAKVFENYMLDSDSYPIAIGSDVHMPFHDKRALGIFFDECKNERVKTIIMNGDWLDFYQISAFIRDPRERDIGDEIKILKGLVRTMSEEFPDVKLVFKLGNHEERYDNYVKTYAPQLFHIPSCRLENVLKMDDEEGAGFESLGVDIVGDKRPIKVDHLYILHGHEYRFSISNPVSPARGLYLRTKKSALCGHFHQTSEHTEQSIGGDIITCWSTGCLCDLTPQYMPLNKWNLGYVIVTKENGLFMVNNRKIVNGNIV